MRRSARVDAHEALLGAARDEFARRGVERARVADIARRAGVSKGAFYLHFATKEDAFRELVARFLGALHDHALRRDELAARAARSRAPAGRDDLSRRIDAEAATDADLLEVLWRNRQLIAALEGASGAGCGELVADFRRGVRALVAQHTADRIRSGTRVRGDVTPELVADLVVGAYEDLARRMAEMRDKPDLAAWARALLRVLYEGILARPAAARPRTRPARRGPRPALPRPDPLVISKEPR